MSWFSIIEAFVIINCIWRLWCTILLWSIGDIIPHRNIVDFLLALSWCLILLLLLLCMLWLLVEIDQTGLSLIALLRVTLLRSSADMRVTPLLLPLEFPIFVLHLAVLVLYHQGLIHQLLKTSKSMRQQLVLETII